jgi:hypothetical protein
MGVCLVDCEEGEISFGGFLFYFTGMVWWYAFSNYYRKYKNKIKKIE